MESINDSVKAEEGNDDRRETHVVYVCVCVCELSLSDLRKVEKRKEI